MYDLNQCDAKELLVLDKKNLLPTVFFSYPWIRFLMDKCAIAARDNLGRPTTTALENKNAFMEYFRSL